MSLLGLLKSLGLGDSRLQIKTQGKFLDPDPKLIVTYDEREIGHVQIEGRFWRAYSSYGDALLPYREFGTQWDAAAAVYKVWKKNRPTQAQERQWEQERIESQRRYQQAELDSQQRLDAIRARDRILDVVGRQCSVCRKYADRVKDNKAICQTCLKQVTAGGSQ